MNENNSNGFFITMLSCFTSIFLFCFLASTLEAQFWDLYRVTWGRDFFMPRIFYFIKDILPFFTLLGGLIFGFLADRFNQKLILALTALFLMAASICALMAMFYVIDQNIMVFVTCCAFIGTITMMGAEIAVSTAFIFNYSATGKRSLYLSLVPLIIVSISLVITAMRFSILLTKFPHFDLWLLAFINLISLILSFLIFIRRSFLLRTNFYTIDKSSKGTKRGTFKFLQVILFSQITVIFILYWQFLNTMWLQLSMQEPTNVAFYLVALKVGGVLLFVIMLAIWGKISDKTSPYKVFTIGLIGSLLLIAPSYWCLSNLNNVSMLTAPIIWFGIFSSALIAPLANLILELVSSKMRATTASLLTVGILFLPYFQYGSDPVLFHRYINFSSYITFIIVSMISLGLAFIAVMLSKQHKTQQPTYEVFE